MRLRSPRSALGMIATLLGVLALAGCGSSSAETAAAPATGGPAAFPVSVPHKYGSTEIPKAPQRVVTVGLVEQDALLALGVVPVGTTEWFGKHPGAIFPWAEDELGSAATPQVLSNLDGIQFEKIAALKPDLIVGLYSDLSRADWTTLSRIAPTIAPPASVANFGASWQTVTRTVGAAVGKKAEAEKLVTDLDTRLGNIPAEHPEFRGASAIMATQYEGYFVYGPEDTRGRLLTSMGFTLPSGLSTVVGKEFGKNLSRERTDLLDTDVVIWLVENYATGKATLAADAVYSKLAVHTDGRDVVIEDGEELGSAASLISVLSLPRLLDGLVPQLVQAIDGKAATAVERAA